MPRAVLRPNRKSQSTILATMQNIFFISIFVELLSCIQLLLVISIYHPSLFKAEELGSCLMELKNESHRQRRVSKGLEVY